LFVGALMSGGGFLALGYTYQPLGLLALIYLLVVTVGTNLGFSYALSTLVNNWFYRRKAFAMSAFQAVDSLLPAVLVGSWPWRLRVELADHGQDHGPRPAGGDPAPVVLHQGFAGEYGPHHGRGPARWLSGPAPSHQRPGAARWAPQPGVPPEEYSMRQTLHSWAFWNLTVGTALRLISKTGVTVHIIPIMASKGVSEQTAAFMFGLQLFLTVPMYLVLGWAADRFPQATRAHVGLPGRHGLLRAAGLALSWHWPAPGVLVSYSPFATPARRPTGRWSASILGARRLVGCGAISSSPTFPERCSPRCL
jgi:hypothetical protein